MKYNGNFIALACRKQTYIALSSCDAENVAVAQACRALMWIIKELSRNFIDEQIETSTIHENIRTLYKRQLIITSEAKQSTK